jgi:sulfoxide reductase heme-binding subunit YedZ
MLDIADKGRTSPGQWAHYMPWSERSGRLSQIKLLTFLIVCAPALYWAFEIWADIPANPVNYIIKQSGDWSMRLMVAVLAVSPLRRLLRLNRLILVRRMLGIAALIYGLIHLLFYFVSQDWDWPLIIDGMLTALYLTTGYVALALMLVLGLTSNDWSIHTLGTNGWRRLHWIVYPAAILSLVHFLLEVRADGDEAAIIAGLLLYLFLFRGLRRATGETRLSHLLILAPICGVATLLLEAAYYKWGTGVHAESILWANLDFPHDIRPGWWVLFAGLVIAFGTKAFERFNPNPQRMRSK